MDNALSTPPCFSFLHGRKLLVVRPEEIVRLEASSNYTTVFFTHHPPLIMAKVLRAYDEILKPYGFIRTHRSHLVNAQYVNEVDETGKIHMKDSSFAGISRRKKREVFNAFLQP